MSLTKLKEEAKALTEKLTLEEKIGMIHGAQLFQTKGVKRLGIPPLKMSDGPMGVRHEFQPDSWETIGLSDDYVTYLPSLSALAATWNRKLAYETGSVLGAEARGRGKDVILAPGINIKRSPLCGRNFEYFSEDPFLTKELAIPYVQGIQDWDVAACVKHFAVNNQETERLWVDVEIDEETLRNIYLPAFYETLINGESYAVMGAYNKLYKEHCCQSNYLLKDILRDEWGYAGVVISDWGAVHNTELAANTPLDIEMSVTNNFDDYFMAKPLKEKIENGEISEHLIDEKVNRILLLMMRLHMMDGRRKAGTYNTPEHREKVLETARESVVLLKNENNDLPLSVQETKRILIVGDNAEAIHSNGGGSAEIKALYEVSPLMGIKSLLGGNVEVTYVRGYIQDDRNEESDINWQASSLEKEEGDTKIKETDSQTEQKRVQLREEAIKRASEYETVIYIGGLNHNQDCEGNDRPDMKLPYEQDILIKEILQANPNTVIVLTGGSPVEMDAWIKNAKTIVWGWYAGMEGGTALAEVLFGITNPSGKLPETFYKIHTDCSAHSLGEFPGNKKVHYLERSFVGYRYNDTFDIEPEFCFGHGLSFTEFSYTDGGIYKDDDSWYVTCDVTNIGSIKGKETIQVYQMPKEMSENQVLQELAGFEKVEILPKETKQIKIKIEKYKEGYKLRIGSSSRDIRLTI